MPLVAIGPYSQSPDLQGAHHPLPSVQIFPPKKTEGLVQPSGRDGHTLATG